MSDISIKGEDGPQGYLIMHTVYLNGEPIVASRCATQARSMSRKLSEARDLGPRGAMRLLTDELGMCEDFARHVFELLTDTSPNIN